MRGEHRPAKTDDCVQTDNCSAVEYLSFYSNGNGESADPADPALIASLNATMMTTANLSMLENAWQQHRLGGMLTVQFCFQWYHNPVTGKSEGHLRNGWEGQLESVLTAATPMIRAGAILAVFLGDEVCTELYLLACLSRDSKFISLYCTITHCTSSPRCAVRKGCRART